MPSSAKICKIKILVFFFYLKLAESAVSWWQFHDGHHSRNFAKINFDFFLYVKHDERKRCVVMAISRWPSLAKFRKNLFRLFSVRQARRKKAQCRNGNFAMATICEISQKFISTFFEKTNFDRNKLFIISPITSGQVRQLFLNVQMDIP